MSSHIFRRVLIALALAIITSGVVKAQSKPIEPNPAAESFVRAQFAKGEPADLSAQFPDERQRGLSSDFLYDLTTATDQDSARRGLAISDAIFPEGIVVDHAVVPFDLLLIKCRFLDEVEFSQSHFKGDVRIQRSEFANFLTLIRAHIDGDLEISESRLTAADAEGDMTDLQVGGKLDLHRSTFAGKMLFIHAEIGNNFEALDASFNYSHRENPQVNFEDSASFDTIKVGGYALLESASFRGSVTFAYANFTRNVGMEGVHFGEPEDPNHATITFNNMKVGNHAFFQRSVFNGWADFGDAQIGGKFLVYNARFNSTLTATSFVNMKTDTADFHSVSFANNYILDGMSYRELQVDDRLGFIDNAEFSEDAYGKLESMLARQGDEGAANKVYITQKWRERSRLGLPAKLGNILLYVLVGYGRRPWLAFVWSALFVAIGCFVFRRREMEPQKPDYAARRYSAFWYSLDQFLPFVDLQAAGVWQPRQESGWVRHYLPIHTLLGWILIPIGLAAVSGLIK